MLSGDLLERYLLATAITFGLLALCGWLAQKYGQNAPVANGRRMGQSVGQSFRQLWSRLLTVGPRQPVFGSADKRDKMRKRESIVLTPQHQLHKVQDGARVYLLATHPHGTTIISSTLEAPSYPRETHAADTIPPRSSPLKR